MKSNKKSPIKDRPLRYTGQSLDEEIDELINDKALLYVVVSLFVIILAIVEWLRFFLKNPPAPITYTFLAFIITLFSFFKIRKIYKKIKSVKLGRDGERVVGQFLESLREKGHRVFHDLIGDNFNLDHVIISRKGIYVIETKTYSKPAKGESKITFDGKQIFLDRKTFITEPIVQVTAASKWLKNILKETTGKDFTVKPVILFPGWFIETTDNGKKSDIWILNPKALPSFIENQRETINQEDMMLASFHISRYIRTN